MCLSKFEANDYCLEDLVKFFSFIGIEYMLEDDARQLSFCLDPNNHWEIVAASLKLKTSEINWIPSMDQKSSIGGSTMKMLKFCVEKKITIGTLLHCLDKTGKHYAIQKIKPCLTGIMERYLIDKNFLIPRLSTNNVKKVMIQSADCGNIFKSLTKIVMLLQINGFISCLILEKMSKSKIDNWLRLVDIIIIAISKNYKENINNMGICSQCKDRYHKHEMSLYMHSYICNFILKCKKSNDVSMINNLCNENNNRNEIITKQKSTFKNMFGRLKKLKQKHKSCALLPKRREQSPKVVNILLDNCDKNEVPEEFSNLPTYDWNTSYGDFFTFLNNIPESN